MLAKFYNIVEQEAYKCKKALIKDGFHPNRVKQTFTDAMLLYYSDRVVWRLERIASFVGWTKMSNFFRMLDDRLLDKMEVLLAYTSI